MNIGRAFGSPTKDPRWVGKIATAILIGFVPLLNLAVLGWGISYVNSVARGNERVLPEWGELGQHWVRGLVFSFASLVYYLPAIVIVFVFAAPGTLVGATAENGVDGLFTALGSVATGLIIAMLFVLVVSVLVQAARTNYALRGTFSSAFDFKAVLAAVRNNPNGYFTAWILSIVAVWGTYAVGAVVGGAIQAVPCLGQILSLLVIPVMYGFGLLVGAGVNGLFGQYAAQAYGLLPSGAAAAGMTAPLPGAARSVAPTQYSSPSPPVAPPATILPGAVSAATSTLPPVSRDASRIAEPAQGASVPGIGSTTGGATGQDAIARAIAAMRSPTDSTEGVQEQAGPDVTSDPPKRGSTEEHVSGPAGAEDVGDEDSVDEMTEAVASLPDDATEEAIPVPEPAEEAELPVVQKPVVHVAPPVYTPPVVFEEDVTAQPVAQPDVPAAVEAPATEPEVSAAVEAPAAEPDVPAVVEESLPPVVSPVPEPAEVARVSTRFVLVGQGGPAAGQRWIVPSKQVRIGRDDTCFICLTDGKVSRAHASIGQDGDVLMLADLGSTNGTLVNGEGLRSESVELVAGDMVKIGDSTILVETSQGA